MRSIVEYRGWKRQTWHSGPFQVDAIYLGTLLLRRKPASVAKNARQNPHPIERQFVIFGLRVHDGSVISAEFCCKKGRSLLYAFGGVGVRLFDRTQ